MHQYSAAQLQSLHSEALARVGEDAEYRHIKSGTIYGVAGIVFIEATMTVAVSYYNPYGDADITFIRPLEEFLEKFEKI